MKDKLNVLDSNGRQFFFYEVDGIMPKAAIDNHYLIVRRGDEVIAQFANGYWSSMWISPEDEAVLKKELRVM